MRGNKMKHLMIILFLVITSPAYANQNKLNNQMIKDCLDVFGYNRTAPIEERLNNFDWQSASWCVAGFKMEESKKRQEEIKAFLKQNPWFKGKNWKWAERAEYTCTKNYSTGLTYCHKPIYLN